MLTKDIQNNFPFLSIVSYGGSEYIGIIINQDAFVTSMYVYTQLRTVEEKQVFLELGEIWWWESNRMIPINIFLKKDIEQFKYSIVTMISKNVNVIMGPTVSLNNLTLRRIKRKNVQLIRRPK
jgi:hypothetical protein